MKIFCNVVVLVFACQFSFGQLFFDASENLPNDGADGQSMDVKAADIDGDGDLDIILANEFQGNTILLNDGNAVFQKAPNGTLPQVNADSEDVIVADFNKDGILDLVFCSEDDIKMGKTNVHEYYLGQSNGTFLTSNYHFPDTEANAVLIFDLNGDEHPDVLFGNNGPIGAFVNNGDGTFLNESNRFPSVNKTTQDLLAVDVDGDNDMDVIEGNENGNIIYINDGTGNFSNETQSRLPQPNIETRKISAGDVDKDGDFDLFLSNVTFIPGRNRQNRLYINDGTGNFEDKTQEQLPSDFDHTVDGIFYDMDYDTHLDIVVSNVFGSPIRFYFNDGNGFFHDGSDRVSQVDIFRDALGVIASDLNGDDLPDLYFCDRNTGNGNKDVLLIKKKLTGSRDEIAFPFSIYPLPADNILFIESPSLESKEIMISIYSIDGKFISKESLIIPGKLEVNKLKSGIYNFLFEIEGQQFSRQVSIGGGY
jgi:hypothetical protein